MKSHYLLPLLFCMSLVGCKDPDVTVSPLGKKLAAPLLLSASPFSQNFDAQGYVQLQGSCNRRIKGLSISFDKNKWAQAPTTPDISGTSLGTAPVNDSNCSDGLFDIYLTKNDLNSVWGLSPNGNGGSEVNFIYLKGETQIGDSEILTITNPNPSSSQPSTVATKIMLEKNWPSGYATAGYCEQLQVYLVNSSGNRGATTGSATTFQIQQRDHLAATTTISAYSTWDECDGGLNAKTSFTIPAGSDRVDVIYRIPSDPTGINQILQFNVINSSSLQADATATLVTVRDSSITNYRFLTLKYPLSQIFKSTCYPLTVTSNKYSTRQPANDSLGGTIVVSSTSTELKFYSDASCSTQSNTFTFTPGYSDLLMYTKYTPAVTSDSFTSAQFSIESQNGNTLNYDFSPYRLSIDLTSKNSITKIAVNSPATMDRNSCNTVQIFTTNDNGTPLPVSGTLTANLSFLEGSIGNFFPMDSSCTSGVSNATYFQAGSYMAKFYFKPTTAVEKSYTLNVGSNGLGTSTNSIYIKLAPTMLKTTLTLGQPGTCKPVTLTLIDDFLNAFTASKNINFYMSAMANGVALLSLYSNISCSNAAPTVFPKGSTSVQLYVNTAGYGIGDQVSITVGNDANLTSPGATGQISN